VDNEISIQDIERKNCRKDKKHIAAGMWSKWNSNSERKRRCRSCSYVVVMSNGHGNE